MFEKTLPIVIERVAAVAGVEASRVTPEVLIFDSQILDSFGVISLIDDLEKTFDIRIDAGELTQQNFATPNAIAYLVGRVQASS